MAGRASAIRARVEDTVQTLAIRSEHCMTKSSLGTLVRVPLPESLTVPTQRDVLGSLGSLSMTLSSSGQRPVCLPDTPRASALL